MGNDECRHATAFVDDFRALAATCRGAGAHNVLRVSLDKLEQPTAAAQLRALRTPHLTRMEIAMRRTEGDDNPAASAHIEATLVQLLRRERLCCVHDLRIDLGWGCRDPRECLSVVGYTALWTFAADVLLRSPEPAVLQIHSDRDRRMDPATSTGTLATPRLRYPYFGPVAPISPLQIAGRSQGSFSTGVGRWWSRRIAFFPRRTHNTVRVYGCVFHTSVRVIPGRPGGLANPRTLLVGVVCQASPAASTASCFVRTRSAMLRAPFTSRSMRTPHGGRPSSPGRRTLAAASAS